MPNSVGFFTPIDFGNFSKKTKSHTLLQNIDSYFFLGGKKAQVLTEIDKNSYEVQLVSKSSSCLLTALKIASYCTVIIPLIMLVAKVICRSQVKFSIMKKSSPGFALNTANVSATKSMQSTVVSKKTIKLNKILKNNTVPSQIKNLITDLIAKGAKPDAASLDLALANTAARLVRELLIENGAKVSDKSLGIALKKHVGEKTMELLFKNGAKATDKHLDIALENQALNSTLEVLIKNGAKVTDKHLDVALANNETSALEMLIKHGAKVSDKSLDIALKNNVFIDTLGLLLKNGAKVSDKSLDIALENKADSTIIELLLNNGARVTDKSYDLAVKNKAAPSTLQLILNHIGVSK